MLKEALTTYEVALEKDTWRLIPSRFPPIKLLEDLLDPTDLEAAYELENLTNDRLRDEVGDLSLVAPEDRITGPGASPIMAAFTHVNPNGSRFTNGSYGVYYAGLDLTTALKETIYHRSKFLKATHEGPSKIVMRCYKARTQATFIDLRNFDEYHREDYSLCQKIGEELKEAGYSGIYYKSVRNPGGECIAAFKPTAVQPTVQCEHFEYVWDGNQVTSVFKMEAVKI